MTRYRFTGNGAGIPGLPHEISEAELNDLNLDEMAEFNEALTMGLYVEITDDKPVRKKSKKTADDETPPEGA